MRRIIALVLLVALGAATGCLTPETKKQWNDAFGDLRQDNIKNIAPITPRKSE